MVKKRVCVCFAGPYRIGDRCIVCGRIVSGSHTTLDLIDTASGEIQHPGKPDPTAPLTDEFLFGD